LPAFALRQAAGCFSSNGTRPGVAARKVCAKDRHDSGIAKIPRVRCGTDEWTLRLRPGPAAPEAKVRLIFRAAPFQ
jgi:hypothetical protein